MHLDPSPNKAINPRENGVPLLALDRQHSPLQDQIEEAMKRVLDSGWFVMGPDVGDLEKAVAQYSGARHAVGCASGSDALLLALMAAEVGPGDEVILPSFTFFATASAVTRVGAKPVFADIDPDTFNIDPTHVERLICPATKAILPVHLFGQCADLDTLCRLAKTAEISVMEDAAQAIGAELNGHRAGAIGDIGCFSFYPTKNLGGAGDGGMLTTNNDELAERLRLLRWHGMHSRYYHQVVGINSRLDSLQAAMLNVKLPHLDQWTAMRQENAGRYRQLFADAGLDRIVGLPPTAPGRRHVWNQYVVRIRDGKRDELQKFLSEVKISAGIYYPLGLHEQECFQHLGYERGDLPETDRATEEVLALPIFPELTAVEQQFVVDRIATFFHDSAGGHALRRPNFLKHAQPRSESQSKPS
jgi:dTDP-4-amino-4,6-dideoxygalactose transaminase